MSRLEAIIETSRKRTEATNRRWAKQEARTEAKKLRDERRRLSERASQRMPQRKKPNLH